ncbi:MAG TPA: hypothetical protein PK228_16570 [Saprospiraceae bacterium]|nr:hypothetical protein [Saprospiraceae bacterium]
MQNKKKRDQQKPRMTAGFLKKLQQLFIYVFLPAEIHYDKRIAYVDKLVYYGAHVLFFSGVVFMIFEVTSIDNTIHGMSLCWYAGFTGILIAAVLILILKKTNPAILYKRKMRTNLLVGIVLGCVFVSASVASFINHRFPGAYQNCRSYSKGEKGRNTRRGGTWLYLKVDDGGEERFEVNMDLYNSVKEGGQVVLCTRKGALGFDFVTEFRLADH